MTDSSAGDSAAEEATPIFDAVQRYIEGLRAADGGTIGMADRVSGVLGVGIPDVIAAARRFVATSNASSEGKATIGSGG